MGLKSFSKPQISSLTDDQVNRAFAQVSEFANSVASVLHPISVSASYGYLTSSFDNRYVLSSSYVAFSSSLTAALDNRYLLLSASTQAVSGAVYFSGGLYVEGRLPTKNTALYISSSAFRQFVVRGVATQTNMVVDDVTGNGSFITFASGASERYTIGKDFADRFVVNDVITGQTAVQYLRTGTSGSIILPLTTRFGINSTPAARFEVQTLSQSLDTVVFYSTEGNHLWLNPSFGGGSFNPLMQASDSGIIFYSGSGAETGGFTLAQWSAKSRGMRIDTNGRFGIGGQPNTSGRFTVNGSGSDSYVAIFQQNTNNGNVGASIFNQSSTVAGAFLDLSTGTRDWQVFNNSNGFYAVRDNTTGADRMTIDTAGNVGIGTAATGISTSAIFEMSASNKAMLLPRAQGSASITPVNGMLFYEETTNTLQCYANGGWKKVTMA